MSDWCILRTSGRHTLRLVETLAEEQYDAWTPVETVTLRARRKHPAEVVTKAVLPGFVFANASRLPDLLALPPKRSAPFEVFAFKGRYVVFPNAERSDLSTTFSKSGIVA